MRRQTGKFISSKHRAPVFADKAVGPIFDVNGNVWTLQSRTASLGLGFAPKVKHDGREIVEHQFMHVGWGTHVSHIRELLSKLSIPISIAIKLYHFRFCGFVWINFPSTLSKAAFSTFTLTLGNLDFLDFPRLSTDCLRSSTGSPQKLLNSHLVLFKRTVTMRGIGG